MTITAHFGFYIDGEQVHIASIEFNVAGVQDAAEKISQKYIEFKKVVDEYGHPTYLEISDAMAGLPEAIDSILDKIIGEH